MEKINKKEFVCFECKEECYYLVSDDDICCQCSMSCLEEACELCIIRLPEDFWDC